MPRHALRGGIFREGDISAGFGAPVAGAELPAERFQAYWLAGADELVQSARWAEGRTAAIMQAMSATHPITVARFGWRWRKPSA